VNDGVVLRALIFAPLRLLCPTGKLPPSDLLYEGGSATALPKLDDVRASIVRLASRSGFALRAIEARC